jgi:hypothetical protein
MNIEDIKKNVIVSDGHILIDNPLKYEKYGKLITVKQLNYYYEWGNFIYYLGMLLERYYLISASPILPTGTDDIAKFKTSFKIALSDKKMFSLLEKVCSCALFQFKIFGKWHRFYFGKINNIKWMRKNFSIDDYLELFIYVFFYNIQGQKKNFLDALRAIGVM